MLFNTPVFLFIFMPFMFLTHAFLLKMRRLHLANLLLVMGSLFFYAWGNPGHVGLLLFSGLFNYGLGLALAARNGCKKALLCFGVGVNLGLLTIFKYAGMFSSAFVSLGGEITPDWNFIQNIALPLGISFYTFQGMSYIIDVFRGQISPQRNAVSFLAYLCMFPQLVAGPIVRYGEIAANLDIRALHADSLAYGIKRFIWGLGKKCVLADAFAKIADAAFAIPGTELSPSAAWIGATAYMLQIYFDFSAYSDMAIGLGRMFGFNFPENFNMPYLSASISEFWRRWHMTLSQWLRDYLYIPLGGSRVSRTRTCINLVIVFAACGLWHGAALNFLLWGLYYSLILIMERLGGKTFLAIPVFCRRIYTLLAVLAGWVLFRAEDLPYALEYYRSMLFLNSAPLAENYELLLALHGYYPALAFIISIFLIVRPILKLPQKFEALSWGFSLAVFLLCCMLVFGSSHRYFIYFRF